jgi:spoIIIJ-associated protein
VEWVEVSGRTLDEAKELALEQLGVAEGDAEVIVLAEPKVGLFGRTRGEARVRARVRPVGPRPKRQRRSRRGGGTDDAPPRAERARPPSGQQRGNQPRASEGNGGTGSRSRRRRRSTSTTRPGGEATTTPATTGPAGNGKARLEKETVMAEGVTREEQAAAAREFLEGLLEEYGFEATVETRMLDEDTIEVAANGGELGLLVGPRGSTLTALQDVVRTVVQHRFPARTDRIVVDVGGYRQRRVAALQRFTQQIAAEVRESGTERALEPMSPADRKVVHDTVSELEGLATRSEGEDSARHVVIAPAD